MAQQKINFILSAKDRTAKAFNSVKARLSKLGTLAKGVAVTGAGAGVGGAGLDVIADQIDRIGKAAEKLGVPVEELSKLEYAANIAAVPFKQLETGVQRLVRRLSEVANTGKGVAESALTRLNLDAKELLTLPVDRQLATILKQLEKLDNQAEKIELAQKLFDSEGVNLIRLSADSIQKYGDELERLGGVITGEEAAAAAQYNDNIAKLSANFGQLTRSISLPVIEKVNEIFEDLGANAGRTELQDVNDQMEELSERIDLLRYAQKEEAAFITKFLYGDEEGKKELAELEKELKDLEKQTDQLKAKNKKGDGLTTGIVEATERDTEALEKALASQAELFAEFNEQIEDAKEEQKEIAEEFADLTYYALNGEERPETPATFQELADKFREAQSAFDAGSYDTAIEKARKTGEVLREMVDQEGGSVYFTQLAKDLERIATAANTEKLKEAQAGFQGVEESIKQFSEAINQQKISIKEIDVSEALTRAQSELTQQKLFAEIELNVNAPDLRQKIQAMIDKSLSYSVDKQGSKQ